MSSLVSTTHLPTAAATPASALARAEAELDSLRSELAESRCLASLSEHNPNPVLRLDHTGRVLYANPATLRLNEGLSPAEQAQVRQQLRCVATSTGIADQSVQVGHRYFQLQVVHLQEPVPSAMLYMAETTERVLAERQLAEQQVFTDQILASTPSVIYVRNAAGNRTFENQAMLELRDRVAQLGPGPVPEALSSEAAEVAHYAQVDAQVLATGSQIITEDSLTLPNGEVRYYHTVKRLLRIGDTRQVLGVSTDITSQKLASQALAQREKLYRDLMTYSQALICTHDLQGTLLTANPAAAALVGQPLAALPGGHLAQFFPAKYQSRLAQYLAHIVQHGSYQGVTAILGPAGQYRYLLYHTRLMREPDQAPYVIAYGQDITERELAARALKRAKLAAEAAVRTRENFLANVSHEIRTPLNGVLGMAALLAKTTLDARQHDYLHIIRRSGQHLLHVINDVLDIAKITSGKLELEATAFNLCDSLGEALRPLALQAQEKGVEFRSAPLSLTCASPWVLSDAHRLNQILFNLVANAIKFTEPGGCITVTGEQLAETSTALTVRFSVQDTGIGIASDKQEVIFDGFVQAYAETARRYGGTGLGLSISQALVGQLGGQLMLSSEPGWGSIFAFVLTLPKAPHSEPAPAAPTEAYDTGALHGCRLLVVEDNEINRTVAQLLLEDWGASVEEAEDGPMALAMVQQRPPYDIILMDIQLPGLNGLDAAVAIRALPDAGRAACPVVALTANAFRADCERYLAAGMAACLAKPFEEAIMYGTLAEVLRTAPAYDLSQLRTLARGRDAFVGKIILSFLHNMPASLGALRSAAAGQQWEEVAKIVHHIKPGLESLGIRRVAAAVQQLENASLAESDQLAAAVALLATQVQRALAALPHELTGPQG